jgi:hypothetical protein
MFKSLAALGVVADCIWSIFAQEKSDREKGGLLGYLKG